MVTVLGRTGHFWQGRFGAVAMDEAHLAAALRYVALNPVRARLVARAEDWPWSSVRAHLAGRADGITTLAPVLARFPDFTALIDQGDDAEAFGGLRRAETIGRPLADAFYGAARSAAPASAQAPQTRPKPATPPDEAQGSISGLSP